MAREKLLLERKYKKGSYQLQPQFTHRSMKHIPPDHIIEQIDMLSDGLVEVDGKEYAFHTLRVLIKMPA